jgi:hypothetical protein
MTSYITPFDQEVISRDMSGTTTLAVSLFVSAFFTGYHLYDIYVKNKQLEKRIEDLESRIVDLEGLEESNAEALQEHEVRIREKQDYDEYQEVEQGKYQAWKGVFLEGGIVLQILLKRKCLDTIASNQEWVSQGEDERACTVRDFYLGNSHPEFSWQFVEKKDEDESMFASVKDSFIDGWRNVLELTVDVEYRSKENILGFVSEESFEGNKTMNTLLKKCIDEKLLYWVRCLVNV